MEDEREKKVAVLIKKNCDSKEFLSSFLAWLVINFYLRNFL